MLFPVAVHYKGSGFDSTDYGRGAKPRPRTGGGSSGEKSDRAVQEKPAKDAGSSDKKAAAAGLSAGSQPAVADDATRRVGKALRWRQRRGAAREHRDRGDVVLGAEDDRLPVGAARLATEPAVERCCLSARK